MGLTREGAWAGRVGLRISTLFALFLLFGPQRSLAQGDRHLVWRSLETKHFEIHYHEPLGMLARHFAAQAEDVHARVAGALDLGLRQRVQIVLTDDDDAANGSASPIPYNVIRLRAAAPDDMSALSDYDDWPVLLLTHEHTHIVHLEHASGIPRLLQAIFGRAYTPQQYLPGWFVEGLAVVSETHQTSAGRGRATLFDMYLRMDALEDRMLGLDWIGFDGEPWPHGNVRYLYGQGFLRFISDQYGDRALGAFVKEYGKRLVPYGLNRAMKRATGKTMIALYDEFRADLKRRAEATQAAVEARGRIEGRRLTFHGETTRSPRFLPDGRIAYMVSDERHVPELRVVDRAGHGERLTRVPNAGAVSATPSGEKVVYSASGYHRGVYTYNELYEVSAQGGRPKALTEAMRAREPDVSPDGKQVAYVTHGAGTSHLVLAELADVGGTSHIVVRSRPLEQVFTPRFSPDGRYLAYGAFSVGGFRDIWLLELATGLRTRVTYDRALDRGPVFSRDGQTLYFASDRTGISNLYAFRIATGAITQVTNVVSGAYQPDVSPDGKTLVYVGYTSKGFDLYTMPVPVNDVGPLAATPSFERPPARVPAPPLVQSSRPYQPARTLYPRAWTANFEDAGNGQQIMLGLDGRDAVGFHAWSLQVTQNLEVDDRIIDVGYSFRRARMPVNVRAYLRDYERTNLVVNQRARTWDARYAYVSLGTRYAWPVPLRSISLRGDYLVSFMDKRAPFPLKGLDPNYRPPTIPNTGIDTRLSLNFEIATAQRQAFDISQSWGYVFDFNTSIRDPLIGSQERNPGFSWRHEQFFRFDFRESVLAFAYNGAWDSSVTVGGVPAQLGPIFDYIAGSVGSPTDYARLRGFPARTGDQLQLLQMEYRALVVRINRGVQTLPIFLRRIHAAVFSDVGDAFTGTLDWSRFGVGIGGELRLDWATDYGNDLTLRAGLAQGLTSGGVLQSYLSMTRVF